jgi:hypothetical protein
MSNAEVMAYDALPAIADQDIPSVPDMTAVPSVCYWGCESTITGAFCDYVGRTEGVCDEHAYRVTTAITPIVDPFVSDEPVSDTLALVRAVVSGAVPTACVIQNMSGNTGVSHYHAAACGDVKREAKRWGQTESDVMYFPFTSVAEILVHEFSDIASDDNEVNSRDWWASMMFNANVGEYGGIRIMPCLSLPGGTTSEGRPIITDGKNYRAGALPVVEEHKTFTQTCATCGEVKAIDGPWSVSAWKCEGCAADDGGFVETMVTKEYDLSVIVDDSTGATISLGWVTLTMNAAQAHDTDRIAEAYGAAHGEGMPRHGWASIILVNEVCDL